MNKKVMAGALAAMLVASSTVFAGSTSKNINVDANLMKVNVNGTSVTADNFLYNGTTYLPLRAVSEAMGAKVDFDQATMTATITDSASRDKKLATSANVYYKMQELYSNTALVLDYVNWVGISETQTDYKLYVGYLEDAIDEWSSTLDSTKTDIDAYMKKDSFYEDSLKKASSSISKYEEISSTVKGIMDDAVAYYKNDSDGNYKILETNFNTIAQVNKDCGIVANAQYDYYMSQVTE